ncbi:hypothetical protein Bcep1808_1452 [Burkholderia vietnamiensis G4]|uniref:Uncharacterized protein n=1 Tax=Burkholderia vietnamiensis (strain G4 / LMG 22486) TaxID=269482 RepID=A4JDV7_BURVG|nr:hypothetical protein Bcep1808_1452 [Burkholderia vietnamiensis G4]
MHFTGAAPGCAKKRPTRKNPRQLELTRVLIWLGREDLNFRPPGPHAGPKSFPPHPRRSTIAHFFDFKRLIDHYGLNWGR